uniref:Uncharacterized protein LOC109683951 n=1 Tax=Castor canadensis TaxID=51338 RepID=A0A8B7U8G2_CASCN
PLLYGAGSHSLGAGLGPVPAPLPVACRPGPAPRCPLAGEQARYCTQGGKQEPDAILLPHPQVQEGQVCPPGLELPAVLLEMETSQRAEEQLLWDLKLLTGSGLGLFWPRWARFGGQRNKAQHAWSPLGQPCGRMGENSELLSSWLNPPPQAVDSMSQNHQLLEGIWMKLRVLQNQDWKALANLQRPHLKRQYSQGKKAAPGVIRGPQMNSGEKESPGPQARTTQITRVKTEGQRQECAALATLGAREGTRAPLPALMPGAQPQLPVSGAGRLAARSTGDSGEQRGGSGGPKTPKPAWPTGVSSAQQETALQRLLELHGAARRRRRRDREQQRLRVLERLRIAGNRHRRVHPLRLPPSTAQLPPPARIRVRRRRGPRHAGGGVGGGDRARRVRCAGPPPNGRTALPAQEDAAGRRRALQEQLQLVHGKRTGWLLALRARNTQNFQELLCPGAEEPAPEQKCPPFPAHPGHCWVPNDD